MNADARRALYGHRVANRLCVDCAAGLLADDGRRCIECAARCLDSARKYRATAKGKASGALWMRRPRPLCAIGGAP